jgi:hypothetical protein
MRILSCQSVRQSPASTSSPLILKVRSLDEVAHEKNAQRHRQLSVTVELNT